jgi:hypothetical protein
MPAGHDPDPAATARMAPTKASLVAPLCLLLFAPRGAGDVSLEDLKVGGRRWEAHKRVSIHRTSRSGQEGCR